MNFTPLPVAERARLRAALRANAEGATILTDPQDTSFVGVVDDEVADREVIRAIKSVPCHY